MGIGDLTVSGLGFLNLAVAVALEGSGDVLEFFLDVFLVADLVGSLHQGPVYGGLDPRVMERSTVQVPVRVGRFAVDGVPKGAVRPSGDPDI